MRDPMVLQALQLSERLRQTKGEDLDTDEYFAISEATGVPEEYIRFLEQNKSTGLGRNFLDRLRTQFFHLDSDVRRYVSSGILGTVFALLLAVGARVDSFTGVALQSYYSIFQIVGYVFAMIALANAASAKNIRAATITGGIFGATTFLLGSIFAAMLLIKGLWFPPYGVLFVAALCGGLGAASFAMFSPHRHKRVSNDKVNARQELLKQLVDLQDQLKEGQQTLCFLSLDVVGSTKMKLNADSLSVEFTFNEYHKFVEQVCSRHYGTVHSTAGDGVTIAFDHPQNALNAAKQIQTGLVEFNALRNKIDQPLQLRAGIHAGDVVAPKAGDITSLNFASVIDIAAHLQKECPIGGVAISDRAAAYVVGGPEAVGTDRICAHETWATIWQRRRNLDSFKMAEATAQ